MYTNYPLIQQMRNDEYTFPEIAETISIKENTIIKANGIRKFISVINNNLYKDNNLLLLNYACGDEIKSIAVEFENMFIILKSAITMLSKDDYEVFLINEKNLYTLPDQRSMLYAKRLLQLYSIPDELLIQQQKEKYPNIEAINLDELQHEIHLNFDNEIKKIKKNAKSNYVKFLITNISRTYK
jgi:hypothetical protein